MPYQCPGCESRIDHLNYQRPRLEIGDYFMEDDRWEDNDDMSNGEITYECPHCGVEYEPEDLIHINEANEIEVPEQETPPNILRMTQPPPEQRAGEALTATTMWNLTHRHTHVPLRRGNEPQVIDINSNMITESHIPIRQEKEYITYRRCPKCSERLEIEDNEENENITCYTCKTIVNNKNSKIITKYL